MTDNNGKERQLRKCCLLHLPSWDKECNLIPQQATDIHVSVRTRVDKQGTRSKHPQMGPGLTASIMYLNWYLQENPGVVLLTDTLRAQEMKILRCSFRVMRMSRNTSSVSARPTCLMFWRLSQRLSWFGHVERRECKYTGQRILRMKLLET